MNMNATQPARHNTKPRGGGFKELVAANRAAGRLDAEKPADGEAKQLMMPTGMRLKPDELAQAKALADADERSVAWFTRSMYLRGLASFLAESGVAAVSPATAHATAAQ